MRPFGIAKRASAPADELQNFLKGFAPSTMHPNNPLATGAMPSANKAAPQFNPNLPGSYTNPSNPNLNPSLPGALNNPANPKFNPNMPGSINNPSNPQRNPSMPSSLTNPSNPQMNPAFPGSFTNPSNPINNPDFPPPSEYPPPAGIGPDASTPPSRWSTFSPRQSSYQLWSPGNWGKGFRVPNWENSPSMGVPGSWDLHTWNTDRSGAPHHMDVIKKIQPDGGYTYRDRIIIGPKGHYTVDDPPTEGITDFARQIPGMKYVPDTSRWIQKTDYFNRSSAAGLFSPRQSDNWQKDNRNWPDPTEPRAAKPPAAKGCTCHDGHKLDCPIHGMNPDDPNYDHSWALPQAQPVSYPQDAPRTWQQAFGKTVEADYYHIAPTVDRERIRQHGLQPSQPARSERWWTPPKEPLPWPEQNKPPAWLQKQPEGVYVSDDPEWSRSWTKDSLEDPDQSAWDTWRIPHEQTEGVYPDPVGGPFNRVIPHEVYPELHEGGPETFGPWPKRSS